MKAKKNRPTLNIVRQIEKEATEQIRSMAPAFLAAQEQVNQVRRIVEPTLKHLSEMKVMSQPQPLKMVPFTPPRPVTYEDLDGLLKKHTRTSPQKSNIDLFFSQSDKSLKRYMGEKILEYEFKKGKKFPLFKILTSLDQGQYIETKALAKRLESPSMGAVHKMVGEINAIARRIFGLKREMYLIEGREGDGYRIAEDFVIHEDKL